MKGSLTDELWLFRPGDFAELFPEMNEVKLPVQKNSKQRRQILRPQGDREYPHVWTVGTQVLPKGAVRLGAAGS